MTIAESTVLIDGIGTLGSRPIVGVGYSKVDSKLYCASNDPNHIFVYHVRSHNNNQSFSYTQLKGIYMSEWPWFIACSPTEHKAYVSTEAGQVFAINTKRDVIQPASRIPGVKVPATMAFSPDGKASYFPSGQVVYAADEQTDAPPVSIPLSVEASCVAITKDGRFGYCGGSTEGYQQSISRVDLALQKEKDLVKNLLADMLDFDIAFGGQELLASDRAGIVDVIDISQNAKVLTLDQVGGWGGIACSPTAPRACVVSGPRAVQIIDTQKNENRGPISAGEGAINDVAFDEYGNAYVATALGVSVILHSKIESM